MTTALVCILTGQNIPNLLSVHALKPDRLILVESEEMKKHDVPFRNAMKEGMPSTPPIETVHLSNETDLQVMIPELRRITENRRDINRWMVNLTGGTKLMGIAAYEVFREVEAEFYYTEINQPRRLIPLEKPKESLTLDHPLTCNEFLLAYGEEKPKPQTKEEKSTEALFPLAVALADVETTPEIKLRCPDKSESKSSWDLLHAGKYELQKGEYRIPDRLLPDFQKLANLLGTGVGVEGSSLVGKLHKIGGWFLTGGWLETFFHGLIRKHRKELRVTDVRMGIRIGKANHEFDIAFVRDFTFHTLECKTGMGHDKEFNALFKAAAVTRQTGALRVKPLFATTDSKLYDKSKEHLDLPSIKSNLVTRADVLGITLISPDAIRQLARETDPDNQAQFLENTLFPKKTTS